MAYNAAEPWGSGFGHQGSPVFTIILSFLNISDQKLQPSCYHFLYCTCLYKEDRDQEAKGNIAAHPGWRTAAGYKRSLEQRVLECTVADNL